MIKSSFLILIITAAVGLAACKNREFNESDQLSKISSDAYVHTKNEFYLKAVGALTYKGLPICTAFLSGPDSVTTAAHCVHMGEALKDYTLKLSSGQTFAFADLVRWSDKDDIAVIKITTRSEVYFETATSFADEPISIVGYSTIQNRLLEAGPCVLKQNSDFQLGHVHNCESVPGSAGSPMFANGKVVGLHLGGLIRKNDRKRTNVAVSPVRNGPDLKHNFFVNAMFTKSFPNSLENCGSKDGVQLPCWNEYLEANESAETLPQYPYAKRPNGCSVPMIAPGEMDVVSMLGCRASFTNACNNHDVCYYTVGTSPSECNTKYERELREACHVSSQCSSNEHFMTACLKQAEAFSKSVTAAGPYFHEEAQERQKQYLSKVEAFIKASVSTAKAP